MAIWCAREFQLRNDDVADLSQDWQGTRPSVAPSLLAAADEVTE
jgi:hypothetical protein